MAEFAESPLKEEVETQDMDEKSVGMISLQEPLSLRIYVDGAANQKGSRVGLVVISPNKIIIEKSLRLGFSATKNEAEYEALLVGDDYGLESGRKNNGDIFRFEIGCGLGKGGVGG